MKPMKKRVFTREEYYVTSELLMCNGIWS